jgi:hypothetical protein
MPNIHQRENRICLKLYDNGQYQTLEQTLMLGFLPGRKKKIEGFIARAGMKCSFICSRNLLG